MEKHYIYIVLTRTNTAISRFIHLAKKDKYTHAAISLDKSLDSMYSFARKYTHYPFLGRFKEENINSGIYRFQKNLPGVIMEIEVSKSQYKKARTMINKFRINSNLYKYNYLGLVDCLLNKESYHEGRFLCSEFVYYILEQIGVVDLKIARNLIRPQTLLNIDGKIIFEGNLKENKYICNDDEHEDIHVFPMNYLLIKFLKRL